MNTVFFILVGGLLIYILYKVFRKKNPFWKSPAKPFPAQWRTILHQEVPYYIGLTDEDKPRFEYKIQEFLLNCKVVGVDTKVETIDEILVASSAIIPIFHFDDWKYTNIDEVILYPDMFNERFETEGEDRRIMGMVGNGNLEGKMLLSQRALRHGFKNISDKKNTAIHEFVHLIDKADGTIDGIPELLMDKQFSIPWLDLMNKKIDEIYEGKSDINPYGATNRAEFLSVISEYFFERPKLLQKKHPELYKILEEIFKQDMSSKVLTSNNSKPRRNSLCPCGSGAKYKNCCGKS